MQSFGLLLATVLILAAATLNLAVLLFFVARTARTLRHRRRSAWTLGIRTAILPR